MIIGKNFGCTHFIIGHDHGSPGNDSSSRPFYPYDEATRLAQTAAVERGIDIITFEEMVYLPFEDEYKLAGDVPETINTISFSGSDVQKRIRTGKKVPDWATFPEVVEELQKSWPRKKQPRKSWSCSAGKGIYKKRWQCPAEPFNQP